MNQIIDEQREEEKKEKHFEKNIYYTSNSYNNSRKFIRNIIIWSV